MADGTHISWTDATWNPVTGCDVLSPGCTNCYAMRYAGTRGKHLKSREGLTTMTKTGPVWNGKVRFNEEWLTQPLHWRKPRMVFVVAHGDLFYDEVPSERILQIFAIMEAARQHTFQVLTKRPVRMRKFMQIAASYVRKTRIDMLGSKGGASLAWPPSNVWLGVSVEDQKHADERIPVLLDTPAARRWISAEPLLGPIDLRHIKETTGFTFNALSRKVGISFRGVGLDWVVAGAESHQNKPARPCDPDWHRKLRDDCVAAVVPFHLKQRMIDGHMVKEPELDGRQWLQFPEPRNA